MTLAGQVKIMGGGEVAFVLRLPAGQVEFSGLFLTLQKYCRMLQGDHSAMCLTFIKLLFVIKIFVLSIFESQLKTGFTVGILLTA